VGFQQTVSFPKCISGPAQCMLISPHTSWRDDLHKSCFSDALSQKVGKGRPPQSLCSLHLTHPPA
jgi:hypothetical protein